MRTRRSARLLEIRLTHKILRFIEEVLSIPNKTGGFLGGTFTTMAAFLSILNVT